MRQLEDGLAYIEAQGADIVAEELLVALSGASTKSMQLLVTWRCPIAAGVDVCDVAPREMDGGVDSNMQWRLQLLAPPPPKCQSGGL